MCINIGHGLSAKTEQIGIMVGVIITKSGFFRWSAKQLLSLIALLRVSSRTTGCSLKSIKQSKMFMSLMLLKHISFIDWKIFFWLVLTAT